MTDCCRRCTCLCSSSDGEDLNTHEDYCSEMPQDSQTSKKRYAPADVCLRAIPTASDIDALQFVFVSPCVCPGGVHIDYGRCCARAGIRVGIL
jgi:hypothetical protein